MTHNIKVLLFKETAGNVTKYIAQGIEKDLVGSGDTMKEALESFERTLEGQILLDDHFGKIPLEDIPEAPVNIVFCES